MRSYLPFNRERKTRRKRRRQKKRRKSTRKGTRGKKRIQRKKQRGGELENLENEKVCEQYERFVFGDKLPADGDVGYLYELCERKEDHTVCGAHVAKVIPLSAKLDAQEKKEITKEVKYLKKAYGLGIAPEYIGYIYCTYGGAKYAIIIMERYGSGTLTNLYKSGEYAKNKKTINSGLKTILNTLYDNHIDHNDLHSSNFLYSRNNDGGGNTDYTLKIIDFGNTKPLAKFPEATSPYFKIEILGSGSKSPVLRGAKYIDLSNDTVVRWNYRKKEWVEVSPSPDT